jgi:hypothetical protein
MEDRSSKIAGIIGTAFFHLFILFLLWWGGFKPILQHQDEGVEVMLGNTEFATSGSVAKPIAKTDLEVPVVTKPTAASIKNAAPVIIQNHEEALAIEQQKKKKAELQKQAEIQKEIDVERTRLANELRIRQEEQRRIGDINSKTSGAFGKGTQNAGSGTAISGKGFQGSAAGNSTNGANSGVGGRGSAPSYSLKGRSVIGSLTRPPYNEQVEGTIVVEIVVSAEGKVVNAEIDIAHSTTAARVLRESAKRAALESRFNNIDTNENQIGSITYVFRNSK